MIKPVTITKYQDSKGNLHVSYEDAINSESLYQFDKAFTNMKYPIVINTKEDLRIFLNEYEDNIEGYFNFNDE